LMKLPILACAEKTRSLVIVDVYASAFYSPISY